MCPMAQGLMVEPRVAVYPEGLAAVQSHPQALNHLPEWHDPSYWSERPCVPTLWSA